jgi:hypothetical protein
LITLQHQTIVLKLKNRRKLDTMAFKVETHLLLGYRPVTLLRLPPTRRDGPELLICSIAACANSESRVRATHGKVWICRK